VLVLGIDPGLSGALASWDGGHLKIVEVPTVKSSGRGNEVNWPLLNELWDTNFFWVDHVYLERVASRPGEGVSSAFKFGTVFGGLRALAASKLLPLTLVTPNVWKKHFGIMASKTGAVRRASELFPANASEFHGPRGGMKDGPAEAALIAHYGFHKEHTE
jgi:crossover junction endodeoxyribonuclease RuvC